MITLQNVRIVGKDRTDAILGPIHRNLLASVYYVLRKNAIAQLHQ